MVFHDLMKFFVVGLGSNSINFGLYLVLNLLGAPLAIAAAIGYLAGVFFSYYFCYRWVFFGKSENCNVRIIKFLGLHCIGGTGMALIILVCVGFFSFEYKLSWLFGASFAFFNNFFGSKYYIFNGKSI
jgi:putative flippase GtrA